MPVFSAIAVTASLLSLAGFVACLAITVFDARHRGTMHLVGTILVPGYALHHLTLRSHNRARWKLLAGFIALPLAALAFAVVAFVYFAETTPFLPIQIASLW